MLGTRVQHHLLKSELNIVRQAGSLKKNINNQSNPSQLLEKMAPCKWTYPIGLIGLSQSLVNIT